MSRFYNVFCLTEKKQLEIVFLQCKQKCIALIILISSFLEFDTLLTGVWWAPCQVWPRNGVTSLAAKGVTSPALKGHLQSPALKPKRQVLPWSIRAKSCPKAKCRLLANHTALNFLHCSWKFNFIHTFIAWLSPNTLGLEMSLKPSGKDLTFRLQGRTCSKKLLGPKMSLVSRPDLSQLLRGQTCLAARVCSGLDLTGSFWWLFIA